MQQPIFDVSAGSMAIVACSALFVVLLQASTSENLLPLHPTEPPDIERQRQHQRTGEQIGQGVIDLVQAGTDYRAEDKTR
jgi:hypothetical protein